MLCLYIFLLYSRLHDYVPYLHLPAVLMNLLMGLLLLSGSLRTAFRRRATLLLVVLTTLFGMSIPFSVWQGGSVDTFISTWLKTVIAFVAVTGLAISLSQIRFVCIVIAIGALVPAMVNNSVQFGRLGGESGRFGDANEFAQLLLVGMILLTAIVTQSVNNKLFRVVALVGALIELFSFLQTGSRGGLIGLIIVLVVLFFTSSNAVRLVFPVVTLVAVFLAAVLLPPVVKDRYTSLIGLDSGRGQTNEQIAAAGSADSRQYLLRKSLKLTAQNPLLGVGLGMFAVAENKDAVSAGLARGNWHETHNMYTQVSSEAGIPAAVCFIAIIISVYLGLSRIQKQGRLAKSPFGLEASHQARWLQLALIGMAGSGLFLSVAYSQELYVILGLSVSLGSFVIAAQQTTTPAAKPAERSTLPLNQRRWPSRVGAPTRG